jgi:hypothetical protein
MFNITFYIILKHRAASCMNRLFCYNIIVNWVSAYSGIPNITIYEKSSKGSMFAIDFNAFRY